MKINYRLLKITFVIAFIGLFFSSCARIEYPSISNSTNKTYEYGQFVWHDLVTPQPEKSMKFYEELFGWTYKTMGSENYPYHVIYSEGKAIGGIISIDQSKSSGEWLSSISVPDVERAVAYNLQKGGETMFKIANYPGRGKSALVKDPQGAYMSFIHSETGDPERMFEENSWLWNELWSSDIDASIKYYKGLVPYQTEKVEGQKAPYFLFKNGDSKLSGVMANPVENMRSAWVPYIRVNDVQTISSRAKELGAVIMLEPNKDIRDNGVAIIQDPYGAPFAIQFWNKN